MYKEIWTIGRILQWTEQYFQSKEMDSPRLDGEVLLSHVLGKDRIYLYTHYDQPLVQEELDAFRPLVVERAKGHSVASLIGQKDFMGLTFSVNDKVLIPRPDTETLVEYILSSYDENTSISILDMCTGPGTILFSLLHYLPHAHGLGLELSTDALEVANANRARMNLLERSELQCSDMFTAIENTGQTFDVIVSNPPYIRLADKDLLSTDVLNEPHMALFGGEDGLEFYRILADQCHLYCKPNGLVAFEVGYDQGEAVKALLHDVKAYTDISHVLDLAGIPRVVTARVKGA